MKPEPLHGGNHASPSKSVPRKLGTIGGTKAKQSFFDVNQHYKGTAKPHSRDSEFVEGPEPHEDKSLKQTGTSPKPARPKLGTIGGSRADRSLASPSNSASPSKPPQRLGVIAGRAKSVQNSNLAAPDELDEVVQGATERAQDAPATVISPSVQDYPRESSQERADRKRLELKRQIEQKSEAPAKKKRKF